MKRSMVLKTVHPTTEETEQLEAWQIEHRERMRLDDLGFRGDEDVVLLGLEDIEDELEPVLVNGCLMWPIEPRRRYIGVPVAECRISLAVPAIMHDADDMEHHDWDVTE
jgi:hypothetical protein